MSARQPPTNLGTGPLDPEPAPQLTTEVRAALIRAAGREKERLEWRRDGLKDTPDKERVIAPLDKEVAELDAGINWLWLQPVR